MSVSIPAFGNVSNTTLSMDGGFRGSTFSNNLFTDLAPLLILFGEQVTKQFFSQSLGWADNILLAMAPLGIITCVISAIRVGGKRWLKALIGRARESIGTAELELLSSTSHQVCELWSGTEIVRERGNPLTKEFIYRKAASENFDDTAIVFDLDTACRAKLYHPISQQSVHRYSSLIDDIYSLTRSFFWRNTNTRRRNEFHKPSNQLRLTQDTHQLITQAPNLTLNMTTAIHPILETWVFALIGVCVQASVLFYAALVTYHWRLDGRQRSEQIPESYGFPFFFIGSIALSTGIMLCSHIIESVTDELDFEPASKPENLHVVRVQRACTVGERHFDSFVIKNSLNNPVIRTSRLNKERNFSSLAIVATILAIGGYIAQFVGLRAMHWSIAMAVLGATLLITGIRTYVRKGLSAVPEKEHIEEGQELSWIALDAYSLGRLEISTGSYDKVKPVVEDDKPLLTVHDELGYVHEPSIPGFHTATGRPYDDVLTKVVDAGVALQQLASWNDDTTKYAQELADAITGVLRFVLSAAGRDHLRLKTELVSSMQLEEIMTDAVNEERSTKFRVRSVGKAQQAEFSERGTLEGSCKSLRTASSDKSSFSAFSDKSARADQGVRRRKLAPSKYDHLMVPKSVSSFSNIKGSTCKSMDQISRHSQITSSLAHAGLKCDIDSVTQNPLSDRDTTAVGGQMLSSRSDQITVMITERSGSESSQAHSNGEVVETIELESNDKVTHPDLYRNVPRSEQKQKVDSAHFKSRPAMPPTRQELREAIKQAKFARSTGFYICSLEDREHQAIDQYYTRFEWEADFSLVDSAPSSTAATQSAYRFYVDMFGSPEDKANDIASQGLIYSPVLHQGSTLKDQQGRDVIVSVDINIIMSVISLMVHSIKARTKWNKEVQKPFLRLLGECRRFPMEPEPSSPRDIAAWAQNVERPSSVNHGKDPQHDLLSKYSASERRNGSISAASMNKSIQESNRAFRNQFTQDIRGMKAEHNVSSVGRPSKSLVAASCQDAYGRGESGYLDNRQYENQTAPQSINEEVPHNMLKESNLSELQKRGRLTGDNAKAALSSVYGLWIERKTPCIQVSYPDPKRDFNVTGSSGLFQLDPIFGYMTSSILRDQHLKHLERTGERLPLPTDTDSASEDEETSHLLKPGYPKRSETVPPHQQKPKSFTPRQDTHPTPSHPTIEEAVLTTTPLPRLCAQEIFTSFLLEMTKLVSKVGGVTERRWNRSDNDNDHRWSNSVFKQMAAVLVQSKLVEDEEEAYMLIIPVFRVRGLLPTRLNDDDDDDDDDGGDNDERSYDSDYSSDSYSYYYSSNPVSADRSPARSEAGGK